MDCGRCLLGKYWAIGGVFNLAAAAEPRGGRTPIPARSVAASEVPERGLVKCDPFDDGDFRGKTKLFGDSSSPTETDLALRCPVGCRRDGASVSGLATGDVIVVVAMIINNIK